MSTLKLLSTKTEVGNIKTFSFETGGLSWIPGQYQAYRLPNVTTENDANLRWFTIASAPSEGVVNISTRVSDSLFKQALNNLPIGETIEASGLEGDFVWDNDQSVTMVAGGIGVTPYRSMFLERVATHQPLNATLLYFGRDDNFAFREEFNALVEKHPELQIKYIIGELITPETIQKYCPDAKAKPVYISGPEPMVEAVGNTLKDAGFTLKQDWFPGYDDKNF